MKLSSANGLKYGTRILATANAPTLSSAHLPKCGTKTAANATVPTSRPVPLVSNGTILPALASASNSSATGHECGTLPLAHASVPVPTVNALLLEYGTPLLAHVSAKELCVPILRSGTQALASVSALLADKFAFLAEDLALQEVMSELEPELDQEQELEPEQEQEQELEPEQEPELAVSLTTVPGLTLLTTLSVDVSAPTVPQAILQNSVLPAKALLPSQKDQAIPTLALPLFLDLPHLRLLPLQTTTYS